MPQAFIQTLSESADYHSDLAALFTRLCPKNTNSLLLESAEISSKNSLKSLLLIKAAVKITCLGQSVTFKALSNNGISVLSLVKETLQGSAKLTSDGQSLLHAEFFPLAQNLDEDSKLQSATVFDGLRVINNLYQHSSTPIFLGGLFAYDLVASFIPMTGITLEDDGLTCPDYVFYLAEHLLRLDHPTQQATLQT
ncbi:MAG TPA: anthranilate synthase component I, partial [Pasteurellaceae bacterium]|nr:anthranilate synthase component I [Pasteurellaceae bacterium]